MEFVLGMFGVSIAWLSVVAVIATLLFPIFWIWMLVDSVVRNDAEYPGGTANERLVWVLMIALVQFVAVIYYFMVYRAVPRGASRVASSAPAPAPAPAPQTPASA